jgi:hypothetical protein
MSSGRSDCEEVGCVMKKKKIVADLLSALSVVLVFHHLLSARCLSALRQL